MGGRVAIATADSFLKAFHKVSTRHETIKRTISFLKRCIHIIYMPGAKPAIEDAAPTQLVHLSAPGHQEEYTGNSIETVFSANVTGFVEKPKERLLDRWLDWIVEMSGSETTFLFIIGGLLGWAFSGIYFSHTKQFTDWQIIISNVQAIVSYIFDSFLMRQQLNSYDVLLHTSARLRSRNHSTRRMLRDIMRSHRYIAPTISDLRERQQTLFDPNLPTENRLGRISTFASECLGHLFTILLFWVGMFIWIGFGPSLGWSNTWQLYINSATSAWMVLIFAFLANIRERHNTYAKRCLNALYELDSALELKLRTVTGDKTPNPATIMPAPRLGKLQRAIFYYADVVGTLVGVVLLLIVIIVWVLIGPAMSFDSNWWLLIGTYAGLIGMIDGFVLRNVQSKLNDFEEDAFNIVKFEDMENFDAITLPSPKSGHSSQDHPISYSISTKMGVICSHEITVLLGVLIVIGLIIGASIMRWSETGQLLCNIPPSIIESFFMMILITGHNSSDAKRRVCLRNMYVGRLRLIQWVNQLKPISS